MPELENSPELCRQRGRYLLQLQCRALDALIEDIANGESSSTDHNRVIIWMLQAVGVSTNSIIKLTEAIDMSIRDCFGIARSAAETAVNAAYIEVGGPDLAGRAIRHLRQKRWRDLKRAAQMGSVQIVVERHIPFTSDDFPGLEEALAEFTDPKGREVRDWTPDNIQKRISLVETTSKHASQSLSAAIFAIYRPSSELLHGSFYGVNYFWQGSLESPAVDRLQFEKLWLYDHFVTLLTSLYFSIGGVIEAVALKRGLLEHLAGQRELDKLLKNLIGQMSDEGASAEHSFTPKP